MAIKVDILLSHDIEQKYVCYNTILVVRFCGGVPREFVIKQVVASLYNEKNTRII